MIERLEFKNFRALKDTTLPLSRFTLLRKSSLAADSNSG